MLLSVYKTIMNSIYLCLLNEIESTKLCKTQMPFFFKKIFFFPNITQKLTLFPELSISTQFYWFMLENNRVWT